MLLSFFVLLLVGIPVALSIATVGFVFGYLGFGPMLFSLLPHRIFGVVTNTTLLAIPLFVFMGMMLERSRLAEDLMDVVGHLAGSLRGGLGLGIIVVGILMGATTGIVGATVVMLGLLTLPGMIRRGYDKGFASGIICASGTLGQIMPPSLVLILLADIMQQSVGTLFAAAMIPGLLLGGIYAVYTLVLGKLRPDMMPPISAEERAQMPHRRSDAQTVPRGAATGRPRHRPCSAPSSQGSPRRPRPHPWARLGAIAITALMGRLSWTVLRETVQATLKVTAMMMFILICAQVFALAFRGLHGEELVKDFFAMLPGGDMANIWFLMLIIFVLGFFIEWIEISYIAVPLFLPVFIAANVDMVWLAMLICVNLQSSFLTPPFGWALIFLRGVAPPEVSTMDIYRGVIPFIGMQFVALVLVFAFPGLATWLPKAIGW